MSETPQEEVREVLRSINRAWLAGRTNEIGQYFHEEEVWILARLDRAWRAL